MPILYIALGGIAGSLARCGVERWLQGRPATLAVNLAGSLVLGFVMHFSTRSGTVPPELRAALTIGFCGAFTTMSTFSYESLGLIVQGEYGRAGIYLCATIIGCLAAVFGGMMLAERML
jgi:CrcB protein